MKEHFCDKRQFIDVRNNCAWIVKSVQGLWYMKVIVYNQFVGDAEILCCPYCGVEL